MSILENAIKDLKLSYDIDYSVISLDNKDLLSSQEQFHKFLTDRKQTSKMLELEERDIEKRVYPKLLLKNAKSMMIFLFPYMSKNHKKNGNLSVYTQGIDYHISVRENLRIIANYIKKTYDYANFYIQVDSGSLSEKFFAYHSGVGTLGMNSLIFSNTYGSFVNIGIIVTDIELGEKIYPKSKCPQCMKCVNACPSKAITKQYLILADRCSSYITQKKEDLSDEDVNIMKKTKKIFGCDICQNVCHLNNNVKFINQKYDIISDIYEKDLNISNKEFKKKYGDRAFSFRGKKVLLRNLEAMKSE